MAEARRGALLQGPEKTATRKETKEKLAGRTRSRYYRWRCRSEHSAKVIECLSAVAGSDHAGDLAAYSMNSVNRLVI